MLFLGGVAFAQTVNQTLQSQLAENQRWGQDAKTLQSQYFQKAEQFLAAQKYTDASDYYQKVLQVTYRQWDIPPYAPSIYYQGTNKQLPVGATRTVTKQLVTDLNQKAKDKLRNMASIQAGAWVDASWNSAETLFNAGKLPQAYALYRKISIADLPDSVHNKYDKLLSQRMSDIEKRASDLLDELKKDLAANDMQKAKAALDSFNDKFGDFAECPALHATYGDMAKSPDFQIMLHENVAAKEFAAAQDLLTQKKLADAEDALQDIVNHYSDAPSGKLAKAKLDEMRADKELMRTIANERVLKDGEEMLRKVRNLRANGLNDEAAKICRKLIAQYPGTDFSDKAAQALKDMGQ